MMTIESFAAEYQMITKFYGDRRAARSGVLLMHHIDAGLEILDKMQAAVRTKAAFCLHPIVQTTDALSLDYIDLGWSKALPLATEYRDKANAYLCKPETDYVQTTEYVFGRVGPMSYECAQMLKADKTQNRMDFRCYHEGTHPRSKQLAAYFDLWLSYLEDILDN